MSQRDQLLEAYRKSGLNQTEFCRELQFAPGKPSLPSVSKFANEKGWTVEIPELLRPNAQAFINAYLGGPANDHNGTDVAVEGFAADVQGMDSPEDVTKPTPEPEPTAVELVGDTPVSVLSVTAACLLSKTLSLGPDGALIKTPGGQLSEGSIQPLCASLSVLAQHLPKLTENSALITTNRPYPEGQRLYAAKHPQAAQGVTRSREDMMYVEGEPTLILFDADPSAHYTAASPELFAADVSTFIPGFAECARLITHSAASWISTDGGKALTEAGGFHIYCVIKNPKALCSPGALKQFKDRILARAWIAGFGSIFIDKNGGRSKRCIVDCTVWTPEHLAFEGAPVLKNGLVQNRPAPTWKDGTYLDLDARLEPLTYAERKRYEELLGVAMAETQAEAMRRRAVAEADRARKLTEQGVPYAQISRRVQEYLDGGILRGEDPLALASWPQEAGEPPEGPGPYSVPVWRVLACLGAFDGVYCADPLEPDYQSSPGVPNRSKAVIRGDRIRSFAHGGRQFEMRLSPGTVKLALEEMQRNGTLQDSWADAVTRARFDQKDTDKVVKVVHDLVEAEGITKPTLKAMLKEAHDRRPPPEHESDAPDLGDAVPDPADVRRELATQCQHLIDGDVLGELVRRLNALGVVGEDNLVRGTYLVSVTTKLGIKYVTPLIVRGQSSSGKSNVIKNTLRALPPERVELMTSGSEKNLFYAEPDAFVEKVLFLAEANRLNDTDSELVGALRTLMSEGYLDYWYTQTGAPGEPPQRAKLHLDGPICFITTTTKLWIDAELDTRLLSLEANESTGQTHAVMEAQISLVSSDEDNHDTDWSDFHAYWQWLALGPRRVVLGAWGTALPDLLPKQIVRMRRDITKVSSLIMASALLNQARRPRTALGSVVATLDDYEVMRSVMDKPLAKTAGVVIEDEIRELVEVVKAQLYGGDHPGQRPSWEFTTRRLGKALGVSAATAMRRVRRAVELEVLIREDDKPNKPMHLDLGDLDWLATPNAGVLPTRAELERVLTEKGVAF